MTLAAQPGLAQDSDQGAVAPLSQLLAGGPQAQTQVQVDPPGSYPQQQQYQQQPYQQQPYQQQHQQQQYQQQPCPPVDNRPPRLAYRPGPVPRGYALEESTIPGLWIPGIALFSTAYIISIFAARPSDNNGTGALYVPVLGPFITIVECSGCDDAAYTALALDGVAQAAGVAMTTLGLALRSREFVRTYNDVGFTVAPRYFGKSGNGSDSYGLSVIGRF